MFDGLPYIVNITEKTSIGQVITTLRGSDDDLMVNSLWHSIVFYLNSLLRCLSNLMHCWKLLVSDSVCNVVAC